MEQQTRERGVWRRGIFVGRVPIREAIEVVPNTEGGVKKLPRVIRRKGRPSVIKLYIEVQIQASWTEALTAASLETRATCGVQIQNESVTVDLYVLSVQLDSTIAKMVFVTYLSATLILPVFSTSESIQCKLSLYMSGSNFERTLSYEDFVVKEWDQFWLTWHLDYTILIAGVDQCSYLVGQRESRSCTRRTRLSLLYKNDNIV